MQGKKLHCDGKIPLSAATPPTSYLVTLQKISAEHTKKNYKHRKCKSNCNAIPKISHARNEKGVQEGNCLIETKYLLWKDLESPVASTPNGNESCVRS